MRMRIYPEPNLQISIVDAIDFASYRYHQNKHTHINKQTRSESNLLEGEIILFCLIATNLIQGMEILYFSSFQQSVNFKKNYLLIYSFRKDL